MVDNKIQSSSKGTNRNSNRVSTTLNKNTMTSIWIRFTKWHINMTNNTRLGR